MVERRERRDADGKDQRDDAKAHARSDQQRGAVLVSDEREALRGPPRGLGLAQVVREAGDGGRRLKGGEVHSARHGEERKEQRDGEAHGGERASDEDVLAHFVGGAQLARAVAREEHRVRRVRVGLERAVGKQQRCASAGEELARRALRAGEGGGPGKKCCSAAARNAPPLTTTPAKWLALDAHITTTESGSRGVEKRLARRAARPGRGERERVGARHATRQNALSAKASAPPLMASCSTTMMSCTRNCATAASHRNTVTPNTPR
jgi:hypothetical protein